MKAVCWHGAHDMRVEQVPDPEILNPRDAIVKISSTAICGSDLHLYDGYIPAMRDGDIVGHEFMGEVVELGDKVDNLSVGDRVVVPFPISCGHCYYCQHQEYSLCDNSNPKAWIAENMYGYAPAGIYGYSHIMGGYAGGQAEFARVPYADVGPLKIPDGLTDDQVLFLTDIFPTGYQAALNGDIKAGDVVAVWGCGPVGQFAIKSAYLLGAERVLAIDRIPERLQMAAAEGGAEIINYSRESVLTVLQEKTGGRGPDVCIDAVGLEAHGLGVAGWYDKVKQTARLQTDRPTALRQALQACRKGGVVSIPGVYGGVIDKLPMGAAFNKSLTFKMGQTHVQKHLPKLLKMIQQDKIDPSFPITHRMPLDKASEAYSMFKNKEDGCIKVVLSPDGSV